MTLRAPKPITPTWYTPESEAEASSPARFKLRGLTTLERLSLADFKIKKTRIFLSVDNALVLFGMCLLDWENLVSHEGAPLLFSIEMRDNLEALSTDLINELGGEIIRLSFLDEVEKKTSSSASKSHADLSSASVVAGVGTVTKPTQQTMRSGKSKAS